MVRQLSRLSPAAIVPMRVMVISAADLTATGRRWLVTILTAAATALLAALGLASVQSARDQADTARWVAHTHQVIEVMQRIPAGVAAAESALRGYSIARDEAFLVEIDPACRSATQAIAEVRELVADNPAQLDRLVKVDHAVRERLLLIAESRAAVEAGGPASIPARARALTRQIVDGVEEMVVVERGLLEDRAAENVAATRRNLRTALVAPVLACVFMLLTLLVLRRELVARRAAESHLSLLLELGDLLQACHSLDEAFEVSRKYLPRLFGGSAGVVALLDGAGVAVARCSWGRAGLAHAAQGFGADACWALRRGQPFASLAGEDRVRCSHVGPPTGDALCVPLAASGEQIGALSIVASPGSASRSRPLAESVAEQLGLALGNLMLRDELKAQSIRDPLTGLFNRRYTEETLERELKGAARAKAPVGVVMIDVDHFKRVNDTHGHEGGDLVLKAIAEVLRSRTRGHDVVARLGGEELLVLMPGASIEAAQAKAEALRDAVSRLELVHRGRRIEITASFGVAAFPEHGAQAAELLRAADQALYTAKRTGRDRVVTAPAPGGAVASHALN